MARRHNQMPERGLFIVDEIGADTPMDVIARALEQGQGMLGSLSPTTHVALRDPYLREQLVALHATWEIRPQPQSVIGRIRSRLAWWLLGPELAQSNRANASLVRIIDSLVVHLDEERAARRRLEEHLAHERTTDH